MDAPVSQLFFLEIKEQLEHRIDDGHGRVRKSLDELKYEVTNLSGKLGDRLDDHEKRVVVVETERKLEKDLIKTRKQDQRDRVVLLGTVTSLIVTIILKLVFNV
jgi:hypothetical protein